VSASPVVVVGDLPGAGKAQERGVVGETPNLAARLQATAAPDCVVISASTRRLTGGLFEYEDLGAVEAKGFTAPVRAWRVCGESAIQSRFEALHSATALTPLVGRDEEIELLLRRWRLSDAQMRRIERHFPRSHGVPRVDDRRIVSGIIFVIRNGLRWRDARRDRRYFARHDVALLRVVPIPYLPVADDPSNDHSALGALFETEKPTEVRGPAL
jgi:hypothetical protein